MSEAIRSSPRKPKLPLQDVVIFVSQQLVATKMNLHQQCTALGGKFVWVFDAPFTHYIHQGKLSKRGKEYRKVEEFQAKCVHPAWLNACQQFGQRVPEKLYASTYNPNRSLTFVSGGDDDDEDEENCAPSLTTTTKINKKPQPTLKRLQPLRSLPTITKKKTLDIVASLPATQALSPKVLPLTPKKLSQLSNEAESMLSDLESSLAQFLHNNTSTITNPTTSISRSMTNEDEQNRKSFHIVRSISHLNNENIHEESKPSMRVEWLDDAMQAERKKIREEDEHGNPNSQQAIRCTDFNVGQKRPLVDSTFDQCFNAKKCRI